jgi:hypothetical protein
MKRWPWRGPFGLVYKGRIGTLQEHEAKEDEKEKGSQKSDEATEPEKEYQLDQGQLDSDAVRTDQMKVKVHGGREGRLIKKRPSTLYRPIGTIVT